MPPWLLKRLVKPTKKEDSIPNQFEYIETQYWFKDRPEVPVWVTILDKFTHHYSHEAMYYIRLEKVGCIGGALVEYKTINEEDLRDMWEKRKV